MKRGMVSSAAEQRFILVLVAGALAGVPLAHATDVWEPDNTTSGTDLQYLISGDPDQLHDLQASGGVADVDMYYVLTAPYRSYEARIETRQKLTTVTSFQRRNDDATSTLQTAAQFQVGNLTQLSPYFLRWEVPPTVTGFNLTNVLRVEGQTTGTVSSVYSIGYRETTLFCPRFNNTNGQVSVLIVQAAHYGQNSCAFTAYFFSEAGGTPVAQQAGTLDAEGEVVTISTPGVPGAANQKGGAQISHTCGYGNIKAKLVALEPATGFSFDTPCTVREK
jgi:hypothetical protein